MNAEAIWWTFIDKKKKYNICICIDKQKSKNGIVCV